MLQIRIWVFGVSPAEPPDRRKALSDIEELRRNHGGTHLLGGTVEEHGGTEEGKENMSRAMQLKSVVSKD